MAGIRLEGDVRKLLHRLQFYSELDKKAINNVLSQGVRSSTVRRFKIGKGPDGKKWKTSIRASAEGGKTLVQSARLRNSIRRKADAGGFAVGTNVIYAATHQYGARRVIRARKAKLLRFQVDGHWAAAKKVLIHIPARPFLGLSDEDMDEIRETMEDFMNGED